MIIRMIAALAYVKEEDVASTYDMLAEIMPLFLQSFLQYFEKNFIGCQLDRRGDPIPAKFPIKDWNIFNKSNIPRTNNHLEGWNHGFASMVEVNHPSIWKFI